MNGVGFEVLARTPVPHLPPIYHTFPLPLPLRLPQPGSLSVGSQKI